MSVRFCEIFVFRNPFGLQNMGMNNKHMNTFNNLKYFFAGYCIQSSQQRMGILIQAWLQVSVSEQYISVVVPL